MNLREYLTTQSLTIPAFAELIGVKVQSVHRYVNGERVPRREVMDKIQAATGGKVQPNDFFAKVA